MGTEILAISFFTTPLIFLISVGLLFKRKFPNPKAIILLALNTLFISYFLSPESSMVIYFKRF
jgi:hypothetical protein